MLKKCDKNNGLLLGQRLDFNDTSTTTGHNWQRRGTVDTLV